MGECNDLSHVRVISAGLFILQVSGSWDLPTSDFVCIAPSLTPSVIKGCTDEEAEASLWILISFRMLIDCVYTFAL